MDSFAIPYTLVLVIMIARWVRHVIRKNWHRFIRRGNTAYLLKAKELTGVGNFFINLTDSDGNALLPLVMLDSNMYGEGGWFYSGFDRIHDDQVEWCMNRLNDLKNVIRILRRWHFSTCRLRNLRKHTVR